MSKHEDKPIVHVQFPEANGVGAVGYIGRLLNKGEDLSLVFCTHTHAVRSVKNEFIKDPVIGGVK